MREGKSTSGVVNAPRRFGVPKHQGLGPLHYAGGGDTDQRPHPWRTLPSGCALLPGREAPGLRYQLCRSKGQAGGPSGRRDPSVPADRTTCWVRRRRQGRYLLRAAPAAASIRDLRKRGRRHGDHAGPPGIASSGMRMRTWSCGKDGGRAVGGRGTKCAHACVGQRRV